MRFARSSFMAAVLLGALASGARAQTHDELERARAQFAAGVELLDAERWAEAAERFRDVLAVRASGQVKYNLAIALERIGRLAEARALLEDVIGDRSMRRARRDAQRLLRSIEPRLARLTVRVSGDADRTTVTLDGEDLGLDQLDHPRPIDPGPHRLSLRRDGETLASREVRLSEGASEEVVLHARPRRARTEGSAALPEVSLDDPYALPVERGPRQPVTEPHEQWWFWTAIGLVGVVVATIVVAVATSQ